MPKNKVSDPITDQESAFARQVLSGTMTDRQAAEAVGLNPDSAAYTKSKPHVRAYMLEHRAAVEQQLAQQEADGLRRLKLDREQVLDRLWELAGLSPEMTRGSISGQVKAITLIIAMENFIPDRRANSSEKKSVPTHPQIYPAAGQPATTTIDRAQTPAPPVPACRGAQKEDSPGVPEAGFAPGSAGEAPPNPGPSQSTSANPSTPSKAPALHIALFTSVPDLGVDFSTKKNPLNPFVRPR
jgi:hypothetical protein